MLKNEWVKRSLLLLFAYLLYLWAWNQTVFAEENVGQRPATIISLQGYLGRDELARAFEQLTSPYISDKSNNSGNNLYNPIVLVINSSSGDLIQVLDLAKKIYQMKVEQGTQVIAYIDDNAVGPAAILPFLADDIYISLFISWGDIPLGNQNALPTNLLRNRVISLIDPKSSQLPLMRLMASAMADPALRIVDNEGWNIAKEEDETHPAVTTKGETLVVNHNQLRDLGLIKGVISKNRFVSMFEEPRASQAPNAVSPLTLEGQPFTRAQFEKELDKHISVNATGPNFIGHILIDDRTSGINESTWLYVKKALESYKTSKQKPIFVILELNTPGGEVFAAQKISDALKELDTQYNIPVVTFINNWAISAGAMLAYSTRFIIPTKDASMGAAEPVYQDETGKMASASEKVNSAIRADFGNRARFFDRDPSVAEAMVDKDIILVKRHGKIIKLDNESQIRMYGQDADLLISPKGKLLTLSAEQMLAFGVADTIVPPTKTAALTSQEQESGRWDASKMALFHLPFFKEIPNAIVESYRMDWKTRFFVLLANPVVSSLLFLGLIIGLYLEMNSPGFGLPAAIAFTCLFLIILSSLSLEIANWLELILLLVGLVVILIELFVLPTFGILGIIGLIFFGMGLFGMMLPGLGSVNFEFDTNTFNAAGEVFMKRLAWLSGTLLIAFIIIAILARYITPSFAKFSRLILNGNEQSGYIAGDNPATLPPPGAEGEVVSTLRPAGKIIIDDKLYDAMSNGGFIEKGTKIVVDHLDGSVIIVINAEEDYLK
ncbi:MAG: serine protease [Parachlamydiaceae bacterium]|nr:serine protease [Parachlamydiaceae bacterium]